MGGFETDKSQSVNMVSLFAGIGGFEQAFSSIGVSTTLMCEIDPVAKHVLHTHFPSIDIADDICELNELPKSTDILCAGFPCQDLSSVGVKQGLSGTRSSLVKEVFRLLSKQPVEWVIFENVSFMLSLRQGEAIKTITDCLEELGYKWAYRSIDSVTFLPQHRCRVFVVASLHNDPRNVLLSGESSIHHMSIDYQSFERPLGFYWTEGRSALGLTSNALPTLKAGSTIGIPSAPAIAFPNGTIGTPDIRDAERLQGFSANWTLCAEEVTKSSYRWKLVGNAVTVDTVKWIAHKIMHPEIYSSEKDIIFEDTQKWPKAAWGANGLRYKSDASIYPQDHQTSNLTEFLQYPIKPLSLKATKGFQKRLLEGNLKCPYYFEQAINDYVQLINK